MSQPLGTAPSEGEPITLEQWFALPEDEPGELVDGRIEAEEMPDFLHEVIVMWLAAALHGWVVDRGGFVGGSDAKFAVAPRRGRKPDLSVYLPGTRLPPARGLIRVPPDIAVEVLSPGAENARRDRVHKRDDYAAFGVRWYWIVDPDAHTLEILERGEDARYEARIVATDVVAAVPGCDGLRLDLAAQ